MKPTFAVLAALLLGACACARRDASPLATAYADSGTPPATALPDPPVATAPQVAQPDPKPTAEEIAAFHAKVPK